VVEAISKRLKLIQGYYRSLDQLGEEMVAAFLDSNVKEGKRVSYKIEQHRAKIAFAFEEFHNDVQVILEQIQISVHSFFQTVQWLTYLSIVICILVAFIIFHMLRAIRRKDIKLREALEELDREKTDLSNLLNNMNQAVFTVGKEGKIIPPVSKFSDDLFGIHVANHDVFEVLYKHIGENKEEYSKTKNALIHIFGEDELQWMFMEDDLPKRVVIKVENENGVMHDKVLHIDYNPLWNKDKTLEKLMFVAKDITEVERLEEVAKEEKLAREISVSITQEMAMFDGHELTDFFEYNGKIIDEIYQLAKQMREGGRVLSNILRELHTLKGNARTFSFTRISGIVHEVETFLIDDQDLVHGNVDNFIQEFYNRIIDIEVEFLRYAKMAKSIFRIQCNYEGYIIKILLESAKAIDLIYINSDNDSKTMGTIKEKLLTIQSIARKISEKNLMLDLDLLFFQISQIDHEKTSFQTFRDSTQDLWDSISFEVTRIYINSNYFNNYSVQSTLWAPIFTSLGEITDLFEAKKRGTQEDG